MPEEGNLINGFSIPPFNTFVKSARMFNYHSPSLTSNTQDGEKTPEKPAGPGRGLETKHTYGRIHSSHSSLPE